MLFTALLGNPVDHSVSTLLFAEYANYTGLEYSHLKLKVPSKQDLADYLSSLHRIGCLGVNVTIPYKLSVMQYLDAIDDNAKAIGAVNTVVMSETGMKGYNTDGVGAYKAIAEHLRPINSEDHITVLGAGGAARAIIYEIYKKTENISVFAPSSDNLTQLTTDFNSVNKKPLQVYFLDEDELFNCLKTTNILINATPVGMYPDSEATLLSVEMINKLSQFRNLENLLAFDAIFNPHTTKMLQILAQYGSPICSGIWMMIYQAVEAFKLWTGQDVSGANLMEIEAKLHHFLKSKY